MATASEAGPTFLGPATAEASRLADALGAIAMPGCPATPPDAGWGWAGHEGLATWRAAIEATTVASQVVVCAWPTDLASPRPVPLVDLAPADWRAQVEWPTALWFTTLVAAVERCSDGGSLVAVVERPATLDAAGRAAEVAVADGVVNLVRSLAAREGGRGVRVNAVLTALGTDPSTLLGAAPPLASFPGRIRVEVAGAVRALLSADTTGVTGTALAAECGRR